MRYNWKDQSLQIGLNPRRLWQLIEDFGNCVICLRYSGLFRGCQPSIRDIPGYVQSNLGYAKQSGVWTRSKVVEDGVGHSEVRWFLRKVYTCAYATRPVSTGCQNIDFRLL